MELLHSLTSVGFVFLWCDNFFCHGATDPSGPRPSRCRGFMITLRHTTLGWTPLDEWSARRTDL